MHKSATPFKLLSQQHNHKSIAPSRLIFRISAIFTRFREGDPPASASEPDPPKGHPRARVGCARGAGGGGCVCAWGRGGLRRAAGSAGVLRRACAWAPASGAWADGRPAGSAGGLRRVGGDWLGASARKTSEVGWLGAQRTEPGSPKAVKTTSGPGTRGTRGASMAQHSRQTPLVCSTMDHRP